MRRWRFFQDAFSSRNKNTSFFSLNVNSFYFKSGMKMSQPALSNRCIPIFFHHYCPRKERGRLPWIGRTPTPHTPPPTPPPGINLPAPSPMSHHTAYKLPIKLSFSGVLGTMSRHTPYKLPIKFQ